MELLFIWCWDMKYNFKLTKQDGDDGEKYTAHWLIDRLRTKAKIIEFPPQKKFDDWDIKTELHDGTITTYEIKNDIMASDTNNIAIEKFNSYQNAPSGIYLSKADWVIYFACGDMFVARRQDLIQKLDDTKKDLIKKEVWGGNGNYSKLLLIGMENIEEFFIRVSKVY